MDIFLQTKNEERIEAMNTAYSRGIETGKLLERKRIRGALLSDEAYDRMTHAAYAHTYKHFTDQEPETLMGEDELIEFRPKREAEMQAALAAIGLTETDEKGV